MAERGLFCRRVFARPFQASMDDRPYDMAEGSSAHRIRLSVDQLGFHIFLSGS